MTYGLRTFNKDGTVSLDSTKKFARITDELVVTSVAEEERFLPVAGLREGEYFLSILDVAEPIRIRPGVEGLYHRILTRYPNYNPPMTYTLTIFRFL